MKLTLEALRQLASELPDLDFSRLADQQDWLDREEVQAYLDFYQINFMREGICQNHYFGKFSSSVYDVAAHIWIPQTPKGTIFLLHGYTDSVGLMQHAIRFFLQQHWAVVCYDLPGHGLSSGDPVNIDCFDEYRNVLVTCLQLCCDKMPAPWRGVGQSTGGAIWMNYLSAFGEQQIVEKVLLLAPLVRPVKWQRIRLLLPIYKLFVKQVERQFTLSSHDQNFVSFIEKQDPLQTTVLPLGWIESMAKWIKRFLVLNQCYSAIEIIQGDADQTVDFKFNIPLIREKFPNNKFTLIHGARHHLLNESEKFRQILFDKIRRWLD